MSMMRSTSRSFSKDSRTPSQRSVFKTEPNRIIPKRTLKCFPSQAVSKEKLPRQGQQTSFRETTSSTFRSVNPQRGRSIDTRATTAYDSGSNQTSRPQMRPMTRTVDIRKIICTWKEDPTNLLNKQFLKQGESKQNPHNMIRQKNSNIHFFSDSHNRGVNRVQNPSS